MRSWCRLALAAVVVLACDDGSISGLDEAESLAGMYQGRAEWIREGVQTSVLAWIVFEESSNGIAGEFGTNRGQRGAVRGTVNGTAMAFEIDQSAPCVATLTGVGSFSPLDHGRIRLMGTYSGDSPCLGTVQAMFDLVRYPDTFVEL